MLFNELLSKMWRTMKLLKSMLLIEHTVHSIWILEVWLVSIVYIMHVVIWLRWVSWLNKHRLLILVLNLLLRNLIIMRYLSLHSHVLIPSVWVHLLRILHLVVHWLLRPWQLEVYIILGSKWLNWSLSLVNLIIVLWLIWINILIDHVLIIILLLLL